MALLILLDPVRAFDAISFILLLDAVVNAFGSLGHTPLAHFWL